MTRSGMGRSGAYRNLNALNITEAELKLIASAAIIGDSSQPVNGYNRPAAIGTPNQWLAGSIGNGTFQIPLTARYIQTGAAVRPGTANGLATFTLAYR